MLTETKKIHNIKVKESSPDNLLLYGIKLYSRKELFSNLNMVGFARTH